MRGKKINELIRPGTGEVLSFKTRQYFVFPDGRCWDNSRKRFLKQCEIQGYMQVSLCDNEGKWHTGIRVHDLVATCFIRLLEKGEVVHHINHVKTDNRVENLQIISASEHSSMHSYENWAAGLMEGAAAKTSEKVKKAWADGRFDGISEKVRQSWAAGAYEGNSEKIKKHWTDGTYDGVAAILSEKMRKKWADGTFDGVAAKASERAKKAWDDGRMDAGREKLKNVGTSYRPARQVAQLSLDGKLVRVWPSTHEAGRNGFDHGAVGHCCRGEYKTHKGYKWMYLSDYLAQHETALEQFEARQIYLDF